MANVTAPAWAAPLVGFKSKKAAQLAAYFAVKSDGLIEKLKLIKLVYWTERRFIANYKHPMLFDELYSLPHGPICSSTLNGIDGVIHEEIWNDYIARNGNIVVSIKRFTRDDLDELSDAEIAIAEKTWRRFGKMTASQLRNYSHQNCPEYTEVEQGRIPISYKQLFEALGIEDSERLEHEIQHVRRLDSLLVPHDPIILSNWRLCT